MNELLPLISARAPPVGGARAFRLFPLEPIGIGSGDVESLTSYITRLGNEHWVSPQHLYSAILKQDRGIGVKIKFDCSLSTYSQSSTRFAASLSKTSPLDLDFALLTYSFLGGIFPTKPYGAFTTRKAWCPCCYQEMYEAGQPLYDKLIWSFQPAPVCVKHSTPLQTTCRRCGQAQKMIVADSVIGHCQTCGQSHRELEKSVSCLGDMSREAVWNGEIAAELTHYYQQGGEFSLETLKRNLRQFVDDEFSGSVRRLSRELNLPTDTFRNVLARGGRLGFLRFIEFCYRVGIPPLQFFSRNGQLGIARRVDKPLKPYSRLPYLTKAQIEEKRRELRRLLSENEELSSTTEIAENLGISRQGMAKRMPEEYKEVVQRVAKRLSREKRERDEARIQKIRRYCRQAIDQGVYPSDRKVKANAGLKASEIRQPTIKVELRKAQDEYWSSTSEPDQALLKRIISSPRPNPGGGEIDDDHD